MSYRWGHIEAISSRTDKYAYDSYDMTEAIDLKQEFQVANIMQFMHDFCTNAEFRFTSDRANQQDGWCHCFDEKICPNRAIQ